MYDHDCTCDLSPLQKLPRRLATRLAMPRNERLCPPAVLSQLYSVGYHAWALQERARWVLDKLVWWLYDAQSFILSMSRNDLTTFDGEARRSCHS